MTSEPQSIQIPPLGGDTPLWRDERVIRFATQILSAILIFGFLFWAVSNFISAANQRGLGLGFNFLSEAAGFPVGESVIPYNTSESFGYAFLVGVLNTLKVAGVGVVAATFLGLLVGLARLSSNWLLSRLALAYIEAHRNIPLLVLLLLWYRGVFTTRLPEVANSIEWPGPIFFSQRGVYMVWLRLNPDGGLFAISIVAGILTAIIAYSFLQRRQVQTGQTTYFTQIAVGLFVGLPIVGWVLTGGNALSIDVPTLSGFNFRGGVHLSPEFAALLIGLVTYTAAFIAEIVRAGIQAVDRGQVEAATAIGLRYGEVLRLVVLPQALRVIIPPLISQYLNLTKNSSLAFFIGYPDLFAIGRIMTNQAGRAVSVIIMVMIAYLSMSLLTSFVLNIYNRRIQFVER